MFKNKLLSTRYWLITKLIGKMPVAANIKFSNYDFDDNFNSSYTKPSMCFNNNIYRLENKVKQMGLSGNGGVVRRHNNMFVLEEI